MTLKTCPAPLHLAITALCAGLVFPLAATAQTESKVTLYGAADAGFVHESGGKNGSIHRISSGVLGGSHWGIKGSENLGGGLSALFTLESGVKMDTGASGQGGLLFGRQALVGLSSALGTLTLGRQYTPAAWVQAETDPFETGLAGTSSNLISPGGIGGDTRMNNSLKYLSPTLSGVQGALVYSAGEIPNSKVNRQFGGSIGYTQGPLLLRAAYHEVRQANEERGKLTYLAATYNFGVLTGYANYVINKGSAAVGMAQDNATDVLLGVTVPLGPGRIMASYIHKNDKTSANNDAKQVGVGYVYPLSKRTSLYTAYAHINNNAANTAATGHYLVGNSTDEGSGNRGFNLGIHHRF